MQASKRTGGWHWQPPEISLPTQHSTTSRTSGFTLALTAPPRTVRPGVKSGRDSSSSSSRQTTRQGRQIPRTNQRKERNPLPRARDGGMQTTSPRTRAPVRRLVGSRCMHAPVRRARRPRDTIGASRCLRDGETPGGWRPAGGGEQAPRVPRRVPVEAPACSSVPEQITRPRPAFCRRARAAHEADRTPRLVPAVGRKTNAAHAGRPDRSTT